MIGYLSRPRCFKIYVVTRSAQRLHALNEAQPVENMPAQWMSWREFGMIEVIVWVVSHTKFLHHAARAHIRWHGETHDVLEAKHVTSVIESGLCTFGRQTLAPNVGRKTPRDLNTRGEMGMEGGDIQADEANESTVILQFSGVRSEAVLSKMVLDLCDQRITLGDGQRSREELHHLGVGVDLRKRLEV